MKSFMPTIYYNTFGSHPVACTVKPGEVIHTYLVDAHGFDKDGKQVSHSPNPQVGPFYVEGAEPGDRLVVKLLKITLNRRDGWSYDMLRPHLVEAAFCQHLPERTQNFWEIDFEHNKVILKNPPKPLKRVEVPIRPVLGCLGVAPERGEAITTYTCGNFGGNMDYYGMVEGMTIYLPVFVPGGLLFLGDGHAVQSQGEVTGAGLETSCEVTFEVGLVKNNPVHIRWLRGEDKTYLYTIGNARPLDLAVQCATTEMVRWLMEDYGLSLEAANVLMSQSVEYEMGNLVSSNFTAICKFSKALVHDSLAES